MSPGIQRCQVISLIFIPLCNIHIIFTSIVFKKEVACVLTIQGSYTRGEFKHTGLILQLELQSAVDLVCLLNSPGKVEVVSFHTLKAYRGSRGTAPHILTSIVNLHTFLTSRWLPYLQERTPTAH